MVLKNLALIASQHCVLGMLFFVVDMHIVVIYDLQGMEITGQTHALGMVSHMASCQLGILLMACNH